MPVIKLIVDGGNMKPGPSVAQQLGPMGINLGKLIEEVNSATSSFKGMKVPVEIDVNVKTKKFTISVFSPPVAELIKKEINVEKGSGEPGNKFVGNLAIEQIIKIAKTKKSNMLAKEIKSAVKLVLGSCVSLGVFVENKSPKDIILEIDKGKYASEISQQKIDVSPEKQKELDIFFVEVKEKQEAAEKAAEAAKAAEEAAKLAVTATTETKPTEEKTVEKKEETKKEAKPERKRK